MKRPILAIAILALLLPLALSLRPGTQTPIESILIFTAEAQTPVVNPAKAQFTASADHASLTKYELRVMKLGTTAAVATQDLGKPTPDGSNTITVTLNVTPPLPQSSTQQYVAFVAAISVAGEGVSGASNPFVIAGPPAPPGTPVVSR